MNNIINRCSDEHSELINTTITSEREDITGRYFYDSITRAWKVVTESQCVYSSLNKAFGYRWPQKHHSIISSKKVSSKKVKWINECSDQQFASVKV